MAQPGSETPPHFLFPSEQRLGLGSIMAALVDDGLISAADARQARTQLTESGEDLHPLVVLANLKLRDRRGSAGHLSLDRLGEWLAERAGLPFRRLDPMKIDLQKVTQVVSQAYAQRHQILPIEVDQDQVVFATSEPFMLTWAEELAQILRREIRRVVVSPLDLTRYLMEFYGVTRSVRGARDAKADSRNPAAGLLNFEQLLELGKSGDIGADDRHVVHIVDWLLQYAFEQRASDIHLEPRREMSRVRFRIDGVMHQVFELPTPVMSGVTSRIKILGRMDVAEKRRPQDGRIKTRSPSGREVELRLSTMPTAFGEKCVMRIFDPDIVVQDFAKLGFTEREDRQWRALVDRPHGIVLVTGPTGSGKTTTLYSTLKMLARPELNVCTVEDPIEMIAPEFNQMQVQHSIDLDFAAGVRTLLRQDPDIIMVGEIRDLEAGQMAIQASLTGHLVLSTLHTNDAPSAITRLLDLGIPYYLIQSTLAGIMAQRLVRTLCPHCKQAAPLDARTWSLLMAPWTAALPDTGQAPKGCVECRRTGFLGRTGIYELMPISSALRALIRPDMELEAFSSAAWREGMRPLRVSAAEKVARGQTTLNEVLKVLPPIEQLPEA